MEYTHNQIKENLAAIREVIDTSIDLSLDLDTKAAEIITLGMRLKDIQGLSAQTQANCRALLEKEKSEWLERIANDNEMNLSPSVTMELVKGKIGMHQAQYEYAVRLDKSITRSMDFLRSSLSVIKAEMLAIN